MKAVLLCASTAALCVAAGFGDGRILQRVDRGKSLSPVRIGQVSPDGTVTEWADYGLRGECDWELAFDCFSDECGAWTFGPPYCNPYVTNDMQFDPWYGGLYGERIMLAWYWSPPVGENMAIVVEFFTDFDDTCTLGDDGLGERLGGVQLDFGFADPGDGYYWTDVDLCGLDWLMLPTDGAGAYSIRFATYEDGNPDELLPATCAQPILKACEPPQSPIQWDDDNPTDWTHQVPDECYDYSWTHDECPTKLLQAALAVYVDANDVVCVGDLNGDNRTEQADLGVLLSDWGCTGSCAGDLDGDGDTDQGDLGMLLSDWGCGV